MARRSRPGSWVRTVMEDGRRVAAPRVVLCARPGSGRFAVVASRTIGGAVQRNRAKRILRAAMRNAAHDVMEDTDIVLIARKAIAGATTLQLTADLDGLFTRLGGSRA